MTSVPSAEPVQLKQAWEGLRRSQPALRIREAAAQLGVSEAELLATGCGETVTRLQPRWADLLNALPTLGRCMALTRNESAVHEKKGVYGPARIDGQVGLVLTPAIDLRLFLSHWHHAFAVKEVMHGGERRSFHIFDRCGTAVHKVYVEEPEHAAAFDRVVESLRAVDQSPAQAVAPKEPRRPDRPDAEIDTAALRQDWLALKDTHEFFPMLGRHGVGRTQALRLAGRDLATPVNPAVFPRLLEQVAADGLSIMVFVGSPGVVQIHTGPVVNIKPVGPWINVLDDGFNLHVRQDQVAAAWVVRKPTVDGPVTSLELFDARGETIALIFGERKPGRPEAAPWRALAENFAQTAAV